MFAILIVFGAALARAVCQYHYQHPNMPFYPQNHYSQGRHHENRHYSQEILNNFQKLNGESYTVIQSGHFSNNQVTNPRFVPNYHTASHVQQMSPNNISPNPVQPIVTKHVYFHAAPPDEEASIVTTPLKKKKTYNLVFIKIPSQPMYNINSQGFAVNPYAPVEDKTVIYVLVKNPEDLQQGTAKSPPNHEVFYVKYKGSANSAAY